MIFQLPSKGNQSEMNKASYYNAAILLLDSGYFDKLDYDEYLKRYPDVKASGLNPRYHYATYGISENRYIMPMRGQQIIDINKLRSTPHF